jgi:hypothetical protein
MNLIFVAFSLLSSFSSAQTMTPVCITVYASDVEFATVALQTAAEQKNLFDVENLQLKRTSGDVVVTITGADASGTQMVLEVRMEQDCGTGKAIVRSITGPTVLI